MWRTNTTTRHHVPKNMWHLAFFLQLVVYQTPIFASRQYWGCIVFPNFFKAYEPKGFPTHGLLAGGFNPLESYLSNWITSLSRGEHKKYFWNHHPIWNHQLKIVGRLCSMDLRIPSCEYLLVTCIISAPKWAVTSSPWIFVVDRGLNELPKYRRIILGQYKDPCNQSV